MSVFRQLMMKNKSGDIPTEYKVLAYIKATGTQYINTGLYANNYGPDEYSFEIKANFEEVDENAIVINSWAAHMYFLMTYNGILRWHGASGGSTDVTGISINTDYTIKLDTKNGVITVNGNSFSYSKGRCGNYVICLFGIYVGQWGDYRTKGLKGKIYYSKFYGYDGVTLVRDYVPVRRKADNVLGFYDKVNGVFYTNNGQGSFIGSDE